LTLEIGKRSLGGKVRGRIEPAPGTAAARATC